MKEISEKIYNWAKKVRDNYPNFNPLLSYDSDEKTFFIKVIPTNLYDDRSFLSTCEELILHVMDLYPNYEIAVVGDSHLIDFADAQPILADSSLQKVITFNQEVQIVGVRFGVREGVLPVYCPDHIHEIYFPQEAIIKSMNPENSSPLLEDEEFYLAA